MNDQERINQDFDKRITTLETKFDSFLREMTDFKNEMRDRDNQRAADIREIRASISNMQNSLDGMGKHVRNLAITSMAAIGGMVIAVGAMIVTVVYSVLKS